MTKPSNFILNSDYATLKNSQLGLTATVSIPASVVIPADSYAQWTQDITITESYAISSCRISSSRYSNRWLVANYLSNQRTNGRLSDGSTNVWYSVACFVNRINSTTVRFTAYIRNEYSALALTTEATSETFSLVMNTFVPPFA